MTDHPCKGMTPRQIDVFEQIAVGDGLPRAQQKTLKKLEDKGLIQRSGDKVLGRDRFGSISIPQFFVPLPIHAQWCEWCSEQPDIEV